MYKQVDPYIPGQSHNDGKKHDEGTNYGQKGSEFIYANEHITDHKSGHRKGNTYAITHIHGAIKERRLYLILGVAMAAALVHLKDL